MLSINELIGEQDVIRARDAKAFDALDGDKCQLCGAYGQDKRTLMCRYFYALKEMVPEMLDVSGVDGMGDYYYLRTCKSCRARFLAHLRLWREECIAFKGMKLDHDGYPEDMETDPDRNIPVRENGVTVMLTREEWDARNPGRKPVTVKK